MVCAKTWMSVKETLHGINESFVYMATKCMLKLKLFHLKIAILVLPCLFIPLVVIYGQQRDNLSYLDIDARNAEIYKRWLDKTSKLERRTIAPFLKSGDENDNKALFNHWSAHQDPDDELKIAAESKRTFKRIIMDGVNEKVIIGEFHKVKQINDTNGNIKDNEQNGGQANVQIDGKEEAKPITAPKKRTISTTPNVKTSKGTSPAQKTPPPSKIILLWNEVFVKQGYLQFKRCPFRNCFITTDKAKLNSSHAVLFNMGGQTPVRFRELKVLPRNPNQSWIFYQRESQLRPLTSDHAKAFNGLFNLTMTFKKSSNIWQPYYHYKLRPEVIRFETNIAEGKTKLVAWLLGNCNENSISSNRMMYFRKLQHHISADLYSNCPGATPCDNDCIDGIYKNYKFIFAAESAICSDFSTAITWKPLTYNIVPIVLGGSNYSSLLPQKSFIDVRDFNSTEHLANHLKNVAKNDKLYNSYFKWKKYYELGDTHVGFCKLCSHLHQNFTKKITQHHLEQFWDKEKDCLTAEKYYEGHL